MQKLIGDDTLTLFSDDQIREFKMAVTLHRKYILSSDWSNEWRGTTFKNENKII